MPTPLSPKRSNLSWHMKALWAVILAGLAGTPAWSAGWAERSAFSEEAVVAGFDGLVPGQDVDVQYRLQGLVLATGNGTPLAVRDPAGMNLQAVSPPHVAVAEGAQTVVLRFEHGVQRVGLYVLGPLGPNDAVLLRTYDEAGREVYTAVYTPPAGDPYLPTFTTGFQWSEPAGAGAAFIGVQADKPVIRWAQLELPQGKTPVIDDVMFEPGPDEGAVQDLSVALDPSQADPDAQVAAIEQALLQPSPAAAEALRRAAADPDLDPYVRERAALALIELADPEAIETLARVGQNTSDPYLRMAAHQAVWALRRAFPMPDPPEIQVVPPQEPVSADQPFEVIVKVTWPVARKSVQARLTGGKGLSLRPAAGSAAFSGSVDADETVTLTGLYRATGVWAPSPEGDDKEIQPRQASFDVVVRVNNGPVDIATYRVPVYVDLDQGTVSVSEPQVEEPADHVIQGGSAQ